MLETLYHKDHHGNLRQWRVWTSQDTIHTEYGLVGGALLTSAKKATPKNEGKANETTAITQALAEAKSMWQKRLDRKYSLTPEEAEMPILQPMLAKSFDEKKFKPGFIQRKIDGSRALGFWENGKIKLLSRGNKEWTVPKHINDQLSRILDKDSVVDGELFLPDVPFEKVMSAIKKYSPITDQVQYIIYDMPVVKGVDDLPFSERLVHMNNLPLTNNLVLCETYFVNTVEEVLDCEKKFVEEKFEGAILRDPDGLYQFGYRSGSILKIKTFEDAEFKVLDVRPGIGNLNDWKKHEEKTNLLKHLL